MEQLIPDQMNMQYSAQFQTPTPMKLCKSSPTTGENKQN